MQFSVKLDPGLSWDMFPYLIVWCESFNADLGHVALVAEGEGVPKWWFPAPLATLANDYALPSCT